MHNPTPGLPAFDYIKPASLREASQFLAAHGKTARPFMGGTDTFVRMRDGFWREKHLVDVKHLEGMNALDFDPASGLTIGAAVNMNRVIASPEVNAHYPLLGQAALTVASQQSTQSSTACLISALSINESLLAVKGYWMKCRIISSPGGFPKSMPSTGLPAGDRAAMALSDRGLCTCDGTPALGFAGVRASSIRS